MPAIPIASSSTYLFLKRAGMASARANQSNFVDISSRNAFALIAAKDRGGRKSSSLGQISHMQHLLAALTAFAVAGLRILAINDGDGSRHLSHRRAGFLSTCKAGNSLINSSDEMSRRSARRNTVQNERELSNVTFSRRSLDTF